MENAQHQRDKPSYETDNWTPLPELISVQIVPLKDLQELLLWPSGNTTSFSFPVPEV